MVLTMAEMRIPFKAAHVHWGHLAMYLDVSKGGNPGWAGLADQLGFTYDEIAHIDSLQDKTGSNTMKMFSRYVEKTNGGCLHTVMRAIENLARYDALRVLSDNMADIETRAHARQGEENRCRCHTLLVDSRNYQQSWSGPSHHGQQVYDHNPPPMDLSHNRRSHRSSGGSPTHHSSPRDNGQNGCNPTLTYDPCSRPRNGDVSDRPRPIPMDDNRNDPSPDEEMPLNLSNRGPKNGMHLTVDLPSNSNHSHIKRWLNGGFSTDSASRNGFSAGSGRVESEQGTLTPGMRPAPSNPTSWEAPDHEMQDSMEVENESLVRYDTRMEEGVVYSNQERPAPVPYVMMRHQLEQNCYSPWSISVGAEEEVTTSEESIESPELAREKYGLLNLHQQDGRTLQPQASKHRGSKHKDVRGHNGLLETLPKVKQPKKNGNYRDGQADAPVGSRPARENTGEVGMRDGSPRVQSLPEPGTPDENRNHSWPLPSTSKTSDSPNRHSWPKGTGRTAGTPKQDDPVKQSKSLTNDFQPSPSRKVPLEVLITYARDSDAHVREVLCLYKCLKKNGFHVKLDIRDRTMGDNITGWVDTNFKKADYIVICISPEYKRTVDSDDKSRQLNKHQQGCHYIHTRMLTEYWENTCRNERFRPLLFPNATADHMPGWLHNTLPYRWRDQWKDILYSMIRPRRVLRIHADNLQPAERPRIVRHKM